MTRKANEFLNPIPKRLHFAENLKDPKFAHLRLHDEFDDTSQCESIDAINDKETETVMSRCSSAMKRWSQLNHMSYHFTFPLLKRYTLTFTLLCERRVIKRELLKNSEPDNPIWIASLSNIAHEKNTQLFPSLMYVSLIYRCAGKQRAKNKSIYRLQ